ncbi:MAG: HAMP domain-containing protein, partial [Burkholderiales bacterium]|nr:HAMP domain-containing protein [Burkholderiales bacterium]
MRLAAAQRSLATTRGAVQARLEALQRTGEAVPAGWTEANAAVDAFAARVAALAGTAKPSGDALALFDAGTGVLERIDTFHNKALHRLDELLQARAARIERDRVWVAALAALGAALAAYFFFAVTHSIRRASERMIQGAAALASGHLDTATQVEGRDEFARIAQSFEQVRGTLKGLIEQMNSMSAEHEAGDIDVQIDAQRFEGSFRTMAQGVNDMVGAHIAVKKMAMGVVADFARGRLDAPIDKLPGKKAFINDIVESVRGQLRAASTAAAENLRIRLALEDVPSAVMVTDTAGVIRFANKSVLALLKRIEPDLRKVVPHFDASQIVGQNFDTFHRNPAHQRGIVDKLSGPHRAQFKFGAHTIRLVASPIVDAQGQRAGSILEWVDRTAEVAAEEDITALVQAAARGDFTRRIDVAQREGFFKLLGEHMNSLLATTERTLGQVSEGLKRIAQGDLSRELEGEYHGVFATLQADLNTMSRQLVTTISDVTAAAQALTAAAGQVSSTSQSLSQSASEQAASVEETTASLQEMAASVKQNADNAN